VVNKKVVGKGVGKNKKIAEQNAAKDALIKEGQLNE
jgi:dsRNA-specific ribonuclease